MLRHSNYIVKQGRHGVGDFGMHKIYRYPNNRGASVVFFQFSYGAEDGLWELIPIRFIGPNYDDWEFDGDVVGSLTDAGVDEALDAIAESA